MFVLGIAFFPRRPSSPANRIPSSGNNISANTLNSAISLECGNGDLCDRLEIFGNGFARRTVLLKLQNIGNGLLSDCRVFQRATAPPVTGRQILLRPATALVPGQYVFFPLAVYWEKVDDGVPGKDNVTITEAYLGGYAHPTVSAPPAAKDNPLLLTVEAIATEATAVQR